MYNDFRNNREGAFEIAAPERLKEVFDKSGLSYIQLEELTGISKSVLQRYASGVTKKIPIDAIEVIASKLRVSPVYLTGWEEETTQTTDEGKLVPVNKEADPKLRAIIDAYHELNGAGKHQLMLYADWLTELEDYQPAKPIKRAMAAYGGGVTELPPLDPDDE